MARILYFAGLAEAIGQTAEDVELPPEIVDVGGLLAWLRSRGPQFEQALAQARLRITVNRQIANPEGRVSNSDEIALIGLPR